MARVKRHPPGSAPRIPVTNEGIPADLRVIAEPLSWIIRRVFYRAVNNGVLGKGKTAGKYSTS